MFYVHLNRGHKSCGLFIEVTENNMYTSKDLRTENSISYPSGRVRVHYIILSLAIMQLFYCQCIIEIHIPENKTKITWPMAWFMNAVNVEEVIYNLNKTFLRVEFSER